MFWNADYGNLTFTSDHGLYTDCDGMGAGDAVLYPGGAPETGEQADKSFYPDAPRDQHDRARLRHARQRARLLGLDGQRRAHHAQQHLRQHRRHLDRHDLGRRPPGLPRPTASRSTTTTSTPTTSSSSSRTRRSSRRSGSCPSGVGIFWAGHNNGNVYGNWIWDNWRNAAFLLSIPNFLVTPEGNVNPGVSCEDPGAVDLVRQPLLLEPPRPRAEGLQGVPRAVRVRQQGRRDQGRGAQRRRLLVGRGRRRTVVKNCWFGNLGPDGTEASVTGPGVGDGNDVLPSDCVGSKSSGDPVKVPYLLSCFLAREGEPPAGAVRLVHAAAQAGVAVRGAQAAGVRRGRARVPQDRPAKQLEDQIGELTGIPVPRP